MKFEELYMHSFVKEAIFRKECSPIFILYNETQIKDMKYHIKNFDVIFYRLIFLKIFSKNCVIGIDRTFNVGTLYATVMTYKNRRVVSKLSCEKDHPISIGPIMLHRESNMREYSHLLHSFKSAIFNNSVSDEFDKLEELITFGSDEEKALTKAIKAVFPKSKYRQCYLHFQKNVSRKLIVSFKCFLALTIFSR